MRRPLLATVLALGLVGSLAAAQSAPLLQLQGEPYFGGAMKLHLSGTRGQPAILAYGLNPLPLDQPLSTGNGPWYIGSLVNLVALGNIPPSGRIDFPFTMPPVMPALAGISIALQGYVPFQLSNPATLPLDMPYFEPADAIVLTSPNPQFKGEFGWTTAAGDLNGDGATDLVITAVKEDYLGIDMSGRVYIHWGPDFSSITALSPPAPVVAGFYGFGLSVANLDGVPPDDLVVAESTGDPAPPTARAKLYVFNGGTTFSTTPSITILSPGSGIEYSGYGAYQCTGDFDDDGATDIAVGFAKADVGAIVDAGRIDVFLGPDFGTRIPVFPPDPVEDGGFGARVAALDVNGDGVRDLVESSPATPMPPWDLVGSAHVFVNPGFVHQQTILCPEPLGTLTRFGDMLAGGDVNQDGLPELVLADFKERVFVMWSPNYAAYSIIRKPPATQVDLFGQPAFGEALALADVTGDGSMDVLISDGLEGNFACQIASSGLVFGVGSPYTATFARIVDLQPMCGDNFSISIVPTELDGDPRVELLVGANFADDGGFLSSGHVTIFDMQSGSGGP